jgi:hypothetical protein
MTLRILALSLIDDPLAFLGWTLLEDVNPQDIANHLS